MTYTREQLIRAMQKYNQAFLNNPDDFELEIKNSEEDATSQVDYLLNLVE